MTLCSLTNINGEYKFNENRNIFTGKYRIPYLFNVYRIHTKLHKSKQIIY